MRQKQSKGEYIAFLASKYDVYPSELFNALITAAVDQKTMCGNLSIECRGKTKTEIIFLVKNDTDVVAQFSVPVDFLSAPANPLLNYVSTDKISKYVVKQAKSSNSLRIKDLRAGMCHVTLNAKILEVSAATRLTTRYGNYASLCKALIADETGKIKLCLWNEQANAVCAGNTVLIEDVRVTKFRGETQLTLGPKGAVNNKIIVPQLAVVE
jgi:hypothetical protein